MLDTVVWQEQARRQSSLKHVTKAPGVLMVFEIPFYPPNGELNPTAELAHSPSGSWLEAVKRDKQLELLLAGLVVISL